MLREDINPHPPINYVPGSKTNMGDPLGLVVVTYPTHSPGHNEGPPSHKNQPQPTPEGRIIGSGNGHHTPKRSLSNQGGQKKHLKAMTVLL